MIVLFVKIFVVFIGIAFFVVVMFSVDGGGVGGGEFEDGMETEYTVNGIAPEVERFRPYFTKYAKEYGIPEHVNILMAMAMQESGGRYADVMQSSESLGLPRNSITDPEKSIKQGVKYFAQVLKNAGGDVELALQSYNFGNGFIDYAKENNNGAYSESLALDFSHYMAEKMGWDRYGDANYVQNVMRYLDSSTGTAGNSDGWALPLKNITITSEFGPRVHPVTGEVNKWHGGLDFACTPADNIMSVADGEVVEVIHSNVGYGNYVTVQHGKNEFSRYAHLSTIDVRNGDEVSQGDALGKCGTTGTSTGNHLHLEHLTALGQAHEEKKDPRKTLGL